MLKIRVLALFLLLLTLGCQNKVTYTEYVSLPYGWHKSSPIIFSFEENDTLTKKNLFIMIRNNEEYDFSNLFLITTLQLPDNKAVIDTLEYEMATPEGKWLGYGYSSVKESKLWLKENFRFSPSGKYTLKIEQAMRKVGENEGVSLLKGITEVGFQVEKIEEKSK